LARGISQAGGIDASGQVSRGIIGKVSEVGVWKRALVYLGLVDEEELEETDEVSSYEEPPPENPVTIRKLSREEVSSVVQPIHPVQPLGQVHIVEPRSLEDAQELGDKIRSDVPVVMNLQGLEEGLAQRLTDFASGLIYGVDGGIQKLAPRLYLITPSGVEVSAEDRRRLTERGLFNEF
jgi:cell division inhibitor SepF